jgi:glycosyltransferase involved in cell wall biosynthesis
MAPYVPPITLFAEMETVGVLSQLRLLPGLLLDLQRKLARADSVSLTIGIGEQPHGITLSEVPGATQRHLVAIGSRRLIELAKKYSPSVSERVSKGGRWTEMHLNLTIGSAFMADAPGRGERTLRCEGRADLAESVFGIWQELASRLELDARRGLRRARHYRADGQVLFPCHADFATMKHLRQEHAPPWYAMDRPSLPYCVRTERGAVPPVNVFFVMPRFGQRGNDHWVRHLAGHLVSLNPAYRPHLVLSEATHIEAHPQWLRVFDTITGLPEGPSERADALPGLFQAADIIIDAGSSIIPLDARTPGEDSAPLANVLAEIREKSGARIVCYPDRVEFDHDGLPDGYLAAAARYYEALIDRVLVPSAQVRHMCLNLGIPDDKLVSLPSAPGVAPASVEAALAIADEKSQRRYTADAPLKVLFVGRLSHEKGLYRLERLAEEVSAAGLPVQFRLIGRGTVPRADFWQRLPMAQISGGLVEESVMADYYTQADVFLRPSRNEGTPLAVLEAMAFGNIVIATNVGAVGEMVEDGKTGLLLDADRSEEDLAVAMRSILVDIIANPDHYATLRADACRRAMEASWTRSAGHLAQLIDRLVN